MVSNRHGHRGVSLEGELSHARHGSMCLGNGIRSAGWVPNAYIRDEVIIRLSRRAAEWRHVVSRSTQRHHALGLTVAL